MEPLSDRAKLAYIAIILWCKELWHWRERPPPDVRFRIFANATAKVRQELIDAELSTIDDESGAFLLENFAKRQPQSDDEREGI